MYDHSTKNYGLHWYISFICTRSFDKNIWPSFFHLFFLFARPFDQKLVSSLNYFFYLYMTIQPKLGVTLTLKFIIFLIAPIFCLQYCLYISSATIIPLYFVCYIHRSAALIFRTLYSWVYEVSTERSMLKFYWRPFATTEMPPGYQKTTNL